MSKSSHTPFDPPAKVTTIEQHDLSEQDKANLRACYVNLFLKLKDYLILSDESYILDKLGLSSTELVETLNRLLELYFIGSEMGPLDYNPGVQLVRDPNSKEFDIDTVPLLVQGYDYGGDEISETVFLTVCDSNRSLFIGYRDSIVTLRYKDDYIHSSSSNSLTIE